MIVLNSAVAAFLRSGIVKIPRALDFSDGSLLNIWRQDILDCLADAPRGLAAPPPSKKVRLKELSPDVWALCEALLGGSDAVEEGWFTNGPVANIGPNPAQSFGWHVDGDSFQHYLDSPEQSLLIIVLWTDVVETSGPTLILPDSVRPVAEALQAAQDGCEQMGLPYADIVADCQPPTKLCGQAGDVFLMHPFVVHTASPKADSGIRLISNPVIRRKKPFILRDGGDCPVSAYTLSKLGVRSVDLPSRPSHERIVPPRLKP
ncbi:MAG: hypothetical protein GQ535_03735 [Rhodobacteraceae bacterium]|nr:hypothetical protein [Paracoccaceae bacterium]